MKKMTKESKILAAIGLLTLVSYIILIKHACDSADYEGDIAWTSVEAGSWNRITGGTQTVARVVLGLRRDGVVVWKEEHLTDLSYSAVFFDDCENERVGALE